MTEWNMLYISHGGVHCCTLIKTVDLRNVVILPTLCVINIASSIHINKLISF